MARANGQFDIDKAYLFDPFRGRDDINRKVLRHVTAAFREDPVRILRLARLAARFPDFSVAPETRQLMCEMVQAGEVDHLVSERIWQELARGLTEKQPSRMIRILAECGALPRLLPEALPLDGALDTRALDVGAAKGASLPVCFACLCVCIAESAAKAADISTDWLKGLFERLRAPSDCRELADVLLRERVAIDQCLTFDAAALVALLERCDAFRKPQRVAELILACECLVPVGQTPPDKPYPQGRHLLKALATAQSVATDSIAATSISTGAKGPVIGEAIRLARVDAVKRDLTT